MAASAHSFSKWLHTRRSVDDCEQVLRSWAQRRGAKNIYEAAGGFVATLGSRSKYRLFGAGIGSGEVPAKLRFALGCAETGTDVHVELTSDEGWYLFQTSKAYLAYHGLWEEVLAELGEEGLATSHD